MRKRFHASSPPTAVFVLSLAACLCTGCEEGSPEGAGLTVAEDQVAERLDPTSDQYMSGPAILSFLDPSNIHLDSAEFQSFRSQLTGFLETNNTSRFEEHFENYYIPETFSSDSVKGMYIRMWQQWDSIGVTNRFDRWSVRYISPFFEGDPYDVAIAEVDLQHYMVFQKHWTGNYRNFGRTLGQRYPEGNITYLDTTFVTSAGDTVFRRYITAEATRLLYAARNGETEAGTQDIRWLNDGWQMMPEIIAVMDSVAVASADAHRDSLGTLASRPIVSGR